MDPIFEKFSELNATQREILTNQSNQQKILEKHSDLLDEHNKILLRNTVTVEEHHRRSLLLEESQKVLEKEVHQIQTHVETVKNIGKLIKLTGYLGTALSFIYMLIKKLGF